MAELIRPIETRRLYQVLADEIRQSIRSGRFPPLSRLPAERELAQLLGVSRPSLREALIALEIDGSVEVRMGSGIYVTAERERPEQAERSLGDSPSEIMQARVAIEGAVAVMACVNMDRDTLGTLQHLLGSMHETIEAGAVPLDQDRAFHLTLAARAGNTVLARLVGELFDARQETILSRLSLKVENTATWRVALAEHRTIMAALEAADPLRAEAAMRTHLQCSADRWFGE